jgi:hypothetical protein
MKNEKSKIKKKFFYFYGTCEHPKLVTVCLVLDDCDEYARGVSVFNREEDEFNEDVGRDEAEKYAIRALRGRKIPSIKRKQVVDAIMESRCPFAKHGERLPQLTFFERKKLFGYKSLFEEEKEEKCICKCIGVAMDTAQKGDLISVAPYGTFKVR